MKKYSVPFYYVVSIDVDADSPQDAKEIASEMSFNVYVDNDLEISFLELGDVYEYEENHADT
jgi:hypothetical protein